MRGGAEDLVDGTTGNTWLQPVKARLLQSMIIAKGAVEAVDVKGRTVSLDVTIADARIEDLLKLAVKSRQPPLTGAITATAKLLQ